MINFNNVKEIRLKNNLTQGEMALKLGMSKANYCKKELGQLQFSLEEAKFISELFNESIEEIFFNNQVAKIET